ncbi:bacterial low temperature requirement A protein-domain-containing protein [Phaeosphaeria sp. MPI-PUGE-AT-0046c]|nr:bacterial low temperature requirement A protein-domain-containing protein [Phaeosphaeria sp. MPI-PUGE-AT-0046c]
MDLSRYFSTRRKVEAQHHHHHSSHSAHLKDHKKKPLRLLANPINKDVRQFLSSESGDLEKSSNGNSSDTTTLAGDGKTSRGNVIIYKQHHEASTIELFYDLFFVANLAYFTAEHQHTDARALIDYLKLFTIMWFTWLITTLFDVRFSIDCVWNRLHKAIQFGVFTGFVFAGPIFDRYNNVLDRSAFKHFGIVLIVSRTALTIQYAVVMWQGRMFRQTLWPLGLSTCVHAIAALLYGITTAVLPRGPVGLEEQVVWVVIGILEGLAIFLIAIFWRILSFKYTHLVERLQLLTLIIIGEGIIGMIKSVASIFKEQSSNDASEIGTVVAAVVLLYLLYMLYFDQLSNDRFGTVRQQIWSLLHYPLHSAILLCVEGNTSLIVWNSAVSGLKFIWSLGPDDFSDPGAGFDNTSDMISNLNQSMWRIDGCYNSRYWNATYRWQSNFTAIENYTAEYGFRSDEWNNRTGSLVKNMFENAQAFVFVAHTETLAKLNAVSATAVGPRERLDRIFSVFDTTVIQFYTGAGVLLLVLAVMYWFNKRHKTKVEFGEMINRVIVGFGLLIVGVATVIANRTPTGFKFYASQWIIPIVLFCFAIVLLLDNLLAAISCHTRRHHSHQHNHSWNSSTAHSDSDNANLIPIAKHHTHSSDSLSVSAPLSRVQTAYMPFCHSPHKGNHTLSSSKVSFNTTPQRQMRKPDSGSTLRENAEEERRQTERFSYQHTPVENGAHGLGISQDAHIRGAVEDRSDHDGEHRPPTARRV